LVTSPTSIHIALLSQGSPEGKELIHHLYSAGQLIGIEDVMIASISLCNGLTVVSANTKHYSRIPDLRIENCLQ
jgi:predicted nucleic acid-binding protein